ncbi:MAG TPA: Nif3-like dinuclear metal center hexameric protein [Thermoanaerobaculia bacterium]
MTIDRDVLVAYLDELLDSPRQADFGPNGLQVEGGREVRKVVTAVSACREVFERAAAAGADLVLVHHGLFWKGMPYTLTGVQYGRVAALIENGLSLVAYHLPLDRHAELGNNALAARAFGLVDVAPFAPYEGEPIGFRGRFPEPIPAAELVARCERVYGQPPVAFTTGPERVATLGIVSGGAQKELWSAIGGGLDAYLTGEASEWVMNVAREAGIHYLAAGHYATERLGIRALGEHVAERFGIEVEFVDVPNPV